MKTLKKLGINKNWTLFLDRDGVINRRLPGDYVKKLEEWEFLPGSLESIVRLSKIFGRLIIVTNQQGIGKELMTEDDLDTIHSHLRERVEEQGGKIDAIYHCSELASDPDNCRKPSPAMALKAKADFPGIRFDRSVMVGDTPSDIEFGKNVAMITVRVGDEKTDPDLTDYIVTDLRHFASYL